MNIDGINTGYVLDHIKAGKGFELYHLLGLDKADCTVAIIQRASSEKYGAKDIIKIDADIPIDYDLIGYIRDRLNDAGVEWREVESLDDAIPELDILYMTRIQQERFPSWEEYEKLKDSFILTRAMLKTAKEDMIVMHPLPRVNEIDVDVDDDPRACYFYQALMGKYIRMALILYLLGIK